MASVTLSLKREFKIEIYNIYPKLIVKTNSPIGQHCYLEGFI